MTIAMPSRQVVVMVTTSYPRFPGDTVGTFMEPIAHAVAARGHDVHLVLPWHPRLQRPAREGRVHFHVFRYAPFERLNVFGYAAALREDVTMRWSAFAVAPLAFVAGWRATRHVARSVGATIVHGHWVVPGGAIAAAAAGSAPLVVSLHGSDVYVAERHRLARQAARFAFGRARWVTACSDDLRQRAIALGAPADRSETIPYGVDSARFRPDERVRASRRAALALDDDALMVFAAGRFVRKKGFEYLIEAVGRLAPAWPALVLVLAGGGDLEPELRARARASGAADRIRFVGVLTQDAVAECLAAADVVVVPSVRDAAGNVDGLPNVVLEALASGAPLVATAAGGIGAVVRADETAVVVPEGDSVALAQAIDRLLRDPAARAHLGQAARDEAVRVRSWAGVAERFEQVYHRASSTAARLATGAATGG